MKPRPGQIPSYVTTDEELKRFELCFAVTRQVAGRDDPQFARELFFGPLRTESDATATSSAP